MTELSEPIILDPVYTGLPEGVPLNPLQVLGVPYLNDPTVNVFVSAPTASGKSTFINMYGYPHLQEDKSILYVGIMKALADEKKEDWEEEDHPWHSYPKAAVTGDYKWTKAHEEAVRKARLLVITPECLMGRLRNIKNDRSDFLENVGLIVIDEVHLVAAGARGAAFEATIVEFCRTFPNVQVLLLSATVPNVPHFVKWITHLTERETVLIRSDYRPVPIEWNFIPYDQGKKMADSEQNRIELIHEIIEAKPEEQHMVAVWKKRFGEAIVDYLRKFDLDADFHNANKDRQARKEMETNFKRRSKRILVSTSTLFTGVNLPAQNMTLSAVEAGMEDIPVYELMQAAGRAGRPKYDKIGYVNVLIPDRRFAHHKNRILNGEPIVSQLVKPAHLAAHFLGAVYTDSISDLATFDLWFQNTLAYQQEALTDMDRVILLNNTIDAMQKRGMIYVGEDQTISLSRVGVIAAQMLLDPYHYADLLRNALTYCSLLNPTDVDLASMYGECAEFYMPYISKYEEKLIPDVVKRNVNPSFWKAAAVVYNRIRGDHPPKEFSNINWQVYTDIDRWMEAVCRASTEANPYKDIDQDHIMVMFTRIKKSCDTERAGLYLQKFTRSEAKALMRLGLYSLDDAKKNPELAQEALKGTRLKELGIR